MNCSAPSCERAAATRRGLCVRCYNRERRAGRIEVTRPYRESGSWARVEDAVWAFAGTQELTTARRRAKTRLRKAIETWKGAR